MNLNYLSAKQLNIKNHLAVLPCGDLTDKKIMNWTALELEPYISYILQGKSIDTMFGGFIFNPISTRENRYIYPLYATFGDLADKVDWQLAIDNLFEKNVNFHAAALSKWQLDIWVALPYPLPLQNNFGIINNHSLNFEQENDRFRSLKWWIESFLERWKKEIHLHATLIFRGFMWQRDAINHQDTSLVKNINKYIHQQNLLTMWLPNHGTNNVTEWKNLGFNATCLNSNYYGNTSYDYQWINHTASFAKFYHTGMQIYYGKGNIFNDKHLIDYLNLGLPQYNNYMRDCLLVYHFPNQNLKEVCEKKVVDYIRLYSFIKGIYAKVSYPQMPY
ncbi:protein of unknown function [Anaerovirgula multivorans]|uniref:DUF4855 domain-containing protein n=1 Tax=Anaerovirgula multivorans TaxID=312168 RepID=A0A238ZQV4_9FIRM|nr:DUF4855 domain-containing protein [Anaerovirgula multivorans]SNR85328.1 protein of unknown function [Anaerovirgula multivorans]